MKHLVEIECLQAVVLSHTYVTSVSLVNLARICLNELARHRITLVFLRLLDVYDLLLEGMDDLFVLSHDIRLGGVVENVTLADMDRGIFLSLERGRRSRIQQGMIVDLLIVLMVDVRMT